MRLLLKPQNYHAKLHSDFYSAHEEEFENLISIAAHLGYGISDDPKCMMEDARLELGYYDNPDEGE